MTVERTVTVVPEAGLHARPAARLVETANRFDADVRLAADGGNGVDAGSMIAVSSLGVAAGDEVRVVASGADEAAALDAVEAVLSTPESGDGGESEGDRADGDGG